MNYTISELIEKRSFEELTTEERQFVLKNLTEEEYREKHQLIAKIKKELRSEAEELNAKDSIRKNALNALHSKKQRKSQGIIPLFINYKIPLWSSMAALLLIFLLTTPFLIDTDIVKRVKTEQLSMRDTVYVEKIVNDTVEILLPSDTVYQTVYLPEKNRSSSNTKDLAPITLQSTPIQKERDLITANEHYNNPIELKKSSSGKSLSDDPIGKKIIGLTQ